jgi:hypothetical protein
MVAMIIMMVIVTTPVTSMVLVVTWRGKEAAGQNARPGEDEQTASQDFRKPQGFRHDGLLAPFSAPVGDVPDGRAEGMVDAAFERAKGP